MRRTILAALLVVGFVAPARSQEPLDLSKAAGSEFTFSSAADMTSYRIEDGSVKDLLHARNEFLYRVKILKANGSSCDLEVRVERIKVRIANPTLNYDSWAAGGKRSETADAGCFEKLLKDKIVVKIVDGAVASMIGFPEVEDRREKPNHSWTANT